MYPALPATVRERSIHAVAGYCPQERGTALSKSPGNIPFLNPESSEVGWLSSAYSKPHSEQLYSAMHPAMPATVRDISVQAVAGYCPQERGTALSNPRGNIPFLNPESSEVGFWSSAYSKPHSEQIYSAMHPALPATVREISVQTVAGYCPQERGTAL